jgi:hypothetical protein
MECARAQDSYKMGHKLVEAAASEWSRRMHARVDMYNKRRVVSFGQAKVLRLLGLIVLCLILLVTLKPTPRRSSSIYKYTEGKTKPWRNWEKASIRQHSDEELYLYYLIGEYGLTQEIPWAARRIKTVAGASTRLSMTDVQDKFLTTDFNYVKITEEDLKLRVQGSIRLRVHKSPRPAEIDASALLVGISTTYSRVLHSDWALVRDWQRWLTDGKGASNGATLFLTLYRADPSEAEFIETQLRKVGMDAVVIAVGDKLGPLARHRDLVERMVSNLEEVQQHRPTKQYLILADDDMFFPNPKLLLERLAKYDHTKDHYIGMPSERLDWMKDNRTLETYGGGAVALTPPLAQRVARMNCPAGQHGVGDDLAASRWDYALYKCITAQTRLNLYVMPSFYNPKDADLVGTEATTLNEGYGSGGQPLTLHQFRAFHRFEAGRGHEITSICGEECFLQRFRFTDRWILVAGFTISYYPETVDAIPLEQSRNLLTQKHGTDVWRADIGERLVIDAPPPDPDTKVVHWKGAKKTWRLLDSQIRENGEIWQAYLKRRSGENSFSDVDDRLEWEDGERFYPADSLIFLIWEP